MDWEEICKTIFTYMKTWSSTPIIFPGQSTKSSGDTWIEFHVLDLSATFVRKSNKTRGQVLCSVGIFSKSENVYSAIAVAKTLNTFLGQHDLFSANYAIRFEELQSGRVLFSGQQDLEKNLQHLPCTVTAVCTEL
jgi:hypothetical protein